MDSDTPISRVGRTFWTVWSYIAEAVNRFLRPETTDSIDPNSSEQHSGGSGILRGDSGGEDVDEEQTLATASLLSSSQPVVSWELCTTEIDLGPAQESNGGSKSKASEEDVEVGEEQFSQTRNNIGLLVSKDARAKDDEEGESGDFKEDMEPLNLTGDAMNEDIDGSRDNATAKDETQEALENHPNLNEAMTKVQVKDEDDEIHHRDEKLEDTEITLCLRTGSRLEEEQSIHVEDARAGGNEVDTTVMHTEVKNCGGLLELALKIEHEHDEEKKTAENQFSEIDPGDSDVTLLEDGLETKCIKSGSMSDRSGWQPVMAHRGESEEREKDERAQNEEENDETADNQTVDEEPEKEEDIKPVAEVREENGTDQLVHNEDAVLSVETELHTIDFLDGANEAEARNIEVHTEKRETDTTGSSVIFEKSLVTTTDIEVDETFCGEVKVEEQMLSSERGVDKETYMEAVCTTTSFTVQLEGETGQEIGREFKNGSQGICEGPFVVLQGLNSLTCEETQEGVPEYNNEARPDEIISQQFLDEGNCKEIHVIELPEEVESKEPQSLQNSGAGGDYLVFREHMEEERENTEDLNKDHTGILQITHTGLAQETDDLPVEPVIEESTHLFEEKEGKSSDSSLKMGIEHSEMELEMRVGLTEEFDETNFFQEPVNTKNFEQNSNKVSSLLEEQREFGFMKESVEPKLLKDLSVEMQDAGIDMEEPSSGVEEEDVKEEMHNNKEMGLLNLEVEGMATNPTTENTAKILFGEFYGPGVLLETENQLADQALGMRNEELLDAKLVDELMTIGSSPKDLSSMETEMAKFVTESKGSYAEQMSSSVSGCQDVIDEEILDLWIQTASLKDPNDMEQEEFEQGRQMDTNIQRPNKQDDMATVQNEIEPLVESNSGESGLLSETEISSSTGESGFMEKSNSECGTEYLDQLLLKSTSTGSIQGIYDVLDTVESVDSEVSTQQPNNESQDFLMKEATEARQSQLTVEELIAEAGIHPNSGVILSQTGYQNDELTILQEKTEEESLMTKSESQEESNADVMDLAGLGRTDWRNTEEANVETNMVSFPVNEKTEVKDVPLEVTVSDPPFEIKHTEPETHRGASQTLLQEELIMNESQDDAYAESKKLPSLDQLQPGKSEDTSDSLHETDNANVASHLTTISEDQTEVDASALDFTAQRARIAVKNPRVRPPKDPRSLLHLPSVDPTPSPHLPVRVPGGVPLGGIGIGIKLPGLGGGFPVLKKTQCVVKEDRSPETVSQEPETKPEEKSDIPKQDEPKHKPKWMPPQHPGFGNPLMSELKTKLKKSTKE
ncbi:uncharacterized protein LOC115060540 isoform X2 [Echeneis naucrates]|uniref:uncharacterized protein LOC115060540 isoform X2 n=1 Tax=Echeneis naucrates TaxID=173247 RepID=UPI001113AFF7|nr:uncharacterized protein LOC115060540 isoform X2 [Echeneis naucrates]